MELEVERRSGERRGTSWLYWAIGLLFIAYALVLFVPVLHCPAPVRFTLVALLVCLCLFDRRGLTLKQLGTMTLLGALVSAGLLAVSWHQPSAALWGVVTALMLIVSIALFSIKPDQRAR